MKRLIGVFLFFLFLSPVISNAQSDLRVIYIRQDDYTDVEILTNALKNFFSQHRDEEILVYYSDVKPLVWDRSSFSDAMLYGAVSSRNSVIVINTLTELDNFSAEFEKHTPLGFKRLTFDFFVSEGFFANGDQNNLVARFLIVNGLENYKKITFNYYPCGGKIEESDLQFDNKYGINSQSIFKLVY